MQTWVPLFIGCINLTLLATITPDKRSAIPHTAVHDNDARRFDDATHHDLWLNLLLRRALKRGVGISVKRREQTRLIVVPTQRTSHGR